MQRAQTAGDGRFSACSMPRSRNARRAFLADGLAAAGVRALQHEGERPAGGLGPPGSAPPRGGMRRRPDGRIDR